MQPYHVVLYDENNHLTFEATFSAPSFHDACAFAHEAARGFFHALAGQGTITEPRWTIEACYPTSGEFTPDTRP